MKNVIILLAVLLFVACGGDVASTDNSQTNTQNNSSSDTNGNGNSGVLNNPGSFTPPTGDTGLTNPNI